MQALLNRTKIRTESYNVPTTTGLFLYKDYPAIHEWASEQAIDVYAYMIASGSTQIETQLYTPELSVKAKEILHKLYRFRQLLPNWDGNQASVPGEDIINKAADLLITADEYDLPIYFTAPGPNGELVLEYKYNDLMAEVFFEEDKNIEMILYTGKDQIYAGDFDLKNLITHFIVTAKIYAA